MKPRPRRAVIGYTATLLLAPTVVTPFVPGTSPFALAAAVAGALLAAASVGVLWAVAGVPGTRTSAWTRLRIAAVATAVLGLAVVAGAVAWLVR